MCSTLEAFEKHGSGLSSPPASSPVTPIDFTTTSSLGVPATRPGRSTSPNSASLALPSAPSPGPGTLVVRWAPPHQAPSRPRSLRSRFPLMLIPALHTCQVSARISGPQRPPWRAQLPESSSRSRASNRSLPLNSLHSSRRV